MSSVRRRRMQEEFYGLPENLADSLSQHAGSLPDGLALVEFDTGIELTWRQFDQQVTAVAALLLRQGLIKGDVVATSLPLTKEHVILMYACFRIGLVVSPLDLRLRPGEVMSCIEKTKPVAYFFFGIPGSRTFHSDMENLMSASPWVKLWVQMCREGEALCAGAVNAKDLLLSAGRSLAADPAAVVAQVSEARSVVTRRDPCLIIFTTGSTGSPKPALLCHENILVQVIGLVVAFDVSGNDRMLVNLPPSHVGCTTEQLATIVYCGGVAVTLFAFDAEKSLAAIDKYRVTMLGQIPALYGAEWRLSSYKDYDLSSLRFAIYGGQAVSIQFLHSLKSMAQRIGSGLGLTELAGFCSYTDPDVDVDELAHGLGYDSPLCPVSIRQPMRADGYAGELVPEGEVGEICYSGPQVFLGYLHDVEATSQTISRDGVCYTGDLGSHAKQAGLRLAGRRKLVIKPKGFQVFPEDVERHVLGAFAGRAVGAACVGAPHERYSEGVMLFVEVADSSLTAAEIHRVCRELSSFARPSHIEIVQPGTLPLNRVAKTDYLALRDTAEQLVLMLRGQGMWDRGRSVAP